MERWVEHISDLYSRQNVVTTAALHAIECLPLIEEVDTEPTTEELKRPSPAWPQGKPQATTGYPPPPSDLIKHCATTLLFPLHDVLCQCWKEGAVPQDMRDAKIVTLYKNNEDRSDLTTTEASRYSAS